MDIGVDVKDQHALSDIETLWKQLLITNLRLPSSMLLGTGTSRIANSGDEDNGEQKDAKIAKIAKVKFNHECSTLLRSRQAELNRRLAQISAEDQVGISLRKTNSAKVTKARKEGVIDHESTV